MRDLTLSANSMLKFDVGIIGEPVPTAQWSIGGLPLRYAHSENWNTSRMTHNAEQILSLWFVYWWNRASKTIQIDSPDYSSKLVIRNVQRGDSGEYTITASNSSGKDSVTVNVNVTDKPESPQGPLAVSDVHKEGCKLKWKRPKDDGGLPLDYYQVEKLDPQTGIWMPCGRSNEPSIQFNFSYITRLKCQLFDHLLHPSDFTFGIRWLISLWIQSSVLRYLKIDKSLLLLSFYLKLSWMILLINLDSTLCINYFIIDCCLIQFMFNNSFLMALCFSDAEITGLTPGKEYKFRVMAVNSEGESELLETATAILAKNPFGSTTLIALSIWQLSHSFINYSVLLFVKMSIINWLIGLIASFRFGLIVDTDF